MSFLLYEDVIFKESDKIRKNLEKIINEKYKIMKGYQYKLKRGLMIIKTLLAIKSSKKINKKIDNSDLQTFQKPNSFYLPISSFNRKKNNNIKSNRLKDHNIHLSNYYEGTNINKNNISKFQESMCISKKIYDHESKFVGKNSSIDLLINSKKKLKKQTKFERNVISGNSILENDIIRKNYEIVEAENFQYLNNNQESSSVVRKKSIYTYAGERKFTFPGKFLNVSCNHLYIIKNYEILIPKHLKIVHVKIYFIFIIYFVILWYLMILIQNIQTKYGHNFIQLCILPFFINLLVKYLFTFNFMMLITTLLLYYFGEYFINNKKVPLLIFGVSKVFISPIVMNHYYAIKLYQYLE